MTEQTPKQHFIEQLNALKAGTITKEQLQKETSVNLKHFKKRVAKLKSKIEAQIAQLKKIEEQKNEEQKKLPDGNRNTEEQ